ncbi:MAG: ATP-binding protein [Crenarchaeota archaeon]|nr:ATP-binding protein [Thermoproteota archaeon]
MSTLLRLDRYRGSIETCFRDVRLIVLVCSGKGGVGKTFISCGLAWYLAEENIKTGLLDLDLHGFSTHRFLSVKVPVKGYKEENGPLEVRKNLFYFSPSIFVGDSPVPIRGYYKEKAVLDVLSSIKWNTDIVIVDMPPGTGEEIILPCRYLRRKASSIIVTLMEPVSIKVSERLVELLKELNIDILGVVYNMTMIENINLFKTSKDLLNIEKLSEIPYVSCVLKSLMADKPPYVECSELRRYFRPVIEKIVEKLEKCEYKSV